MTAESEPEYMPWEYASGCDLRAVIKEILHHNGGRYSVEVQKLCFHADLYAVEQYGRRVTDVDYGAYMYGPYAEVISEELEAAESASWMTITPTMRKGRPDKRYDSTEESESLADGCQKIIRETVNQLTHLDTSELTNASRRRTIYRLTDGGETLNFAEYNTQLESGDVTPDLADWGPPVDRDGLSEQEFKNKNERIYRDLLPVNL
jgi:hypothetical protein